MGTWFHAEVATALSSLKTKMVQGSVGACHASKVQALLHTIIRVTVIRCHVNFYLQVEGVKALTNTYKQIQDSFAEQVVIYLQTAWRRYAAKKQSNMVNEQRKATRTSSFDQELQTSSSMIDADSFDG